MTSFIVLSDVYVGEDAHSGVSDAQIRAFCEANNGNLAFIMHTHIVDGNAMFYPSTNDMMISNRKDVPNYIYDIKNNQIGYYYNAGDRIMITQAVADGLAEGNRRRLTDQYNATTATRTYRDALNRSAKNGAWVTP